MKTHLKVMGFLLLSLGMLSLVVAKPVDTIPLSGTVALTFDDGPNPKHTRAILKILKRNNIHATFFVMGVLAKKYPDLILEMAKAGHPIAIHTMTHPKLTKVSQKKLVYEIRQSKKIVNTILGVPPTCLRPPFGLVNARVRTVAKANGIIVVPIGFNSFDYENRGVNRLVHWVVENARSKMVILLHDGYFKRQQTVKALPMIIEGIRKKGLGFSVICQNQLPA